MEFPMGSKNSSSAAHFECCEEAFSYIWQEKVEKIKRRVTKPACYGKNQEISQQYFHKAETLRRATKYKEAIDHFRLALCTAIFSTDLYAEILCNLSATYYMINEITLSHRYLTSFVEVLEIDQQEEILTNLEKAYFKFLKGHDIGKIWTEILKATDCNEVKNAVRVLKDAFMNTDITFELFGKNKLIIPKVETNNSFLNVITKATLMYNEERGRHVIANDLISQGEVILYETPYVAHTTSKYICGNCNQSVAFFIPCFHCSSRVYCSHSCQEDHKLVHTFECKVYQLLHPEDLTICAHLGFQAFLKGLVKNGYQYPSPSVQEQLCKFGDARNNFPYVRSMKSYFQSYCKNYDLFTTIGYNCAVIALYLCNRVDFVKWIKSLNGFQNLSDAKLFLKVGSEIMRLSFLSEADLLENMKVSSANVKITGFYPSLSMFNHSCMPNTSKYYVGSFAVITASKPIKPGEEICCEYGYEFLTPLQTRKMIFERVYEFECKCNGCTKNKYLNANVPTLFCINCLNFRMVLSSNSLANCTSCSAYSVLNPKIPEKLKLIEDYMKELRNEFSLLIANKIQQTKLECMLRLPYKEEIEFTYLSAEHCLLKGEYEQFIKLLVRFHSLHYPCKFIFYFYTKFIELFQYLLWQIMRGGEYYGICMKEPIEFGLTFLEDYEVYLRLYRPLTSKLNQVRMMYCAIRCYKELNNDFMSKKKEFKDGIYYDF